MVKKIFYLLFIIVCLLFSSCAIRKAPIITPIAPSKQDIEAKHFKVDPREANIYIFRDDRFAYKLTIPLYINGISIGSTGAETYIKITVDPGTYNIMSEMENKDQVSIQVKGGNNYFIWQEGKMGWKKARIKLHVVAPQNGMERVKKCKLVQDISLATKKLSARSKAILQKNNTVSRANESYSSNQRKTEEDITQETGIFRVGEKPPLNTTPAIFEIENIQIQPNPVAGGDQLKINTAVFLSNNSTTMENISVTAQYSIEQHGRTLKKFDPEEVQVKNGETTNLVKKINAAKRKGDYEVKVEFSYMNKKTTKSSPFKIF